MQINNARWKDSKKCRNPKSPLRYLSINIYLVTSCNDMQPYSFVINNIRQRIWQGKSFTHIISRNLLRKKKFNPSNNMCISKTNPTHFSHTLWYNSSTPQRVMKKKSQGKNHSLPVAAKWVSNSVSDSIRAAIISRALALKWRGLTPCAYSSSMISKGTPCFEDLRLAKVNVMNVTREKFVWQIE